MPIVLALILAAKAAHAHYKDNDNEESTHKQADSINNNNNNVERPSIQPKMEKRGAYLLNVKNGRISLPPETIRDNSNVNGSLHDIKGALSSQEMTSTLMGHPVDLDDTIPDSEVDTSFETVMSTSQHLNEATTLIDGEATDGGEVTTFRNDVRNEWIDAMFGVDFFPLHPATTANGGSTSDGGSEDKDGWRDVRIRQGVGAAGVGSWVCYGALLDHNSSNSGDNYNSSDNNDRRGSNEKSNSRSNETETPRRNSLASLLKTKSTPLPVSRSTSNLSSVSFLNTDQSDPDFNPNNNNGTSNNNGSSNNTSSKNNGGRQKIGATITRIPLGLYVKSISINSEGYAAGISPGSILLDVNGIGLLGEGSHRALERVWGYAGIFDDTTTASTKDGGTSMKANHPIQLRFYKHNTIYSVLLLGSNPLKDIEWAPCGNFGLVQRVTPNGLASQSGLRRGCLILGVNGVGCRMLDHAGVAVELTARYNEGKPVVLTCGYTPASSRSGYCENERVEKKGNGSGGGNVEVRLRTVEYGAVLSETFFACTAPSMALVDDADVLAGAAGGGIAAKNSFKRNKNSVASELAAYVASGGVLSSDFADLLGIQHDESPSPQQQQRRRVAGNFGPCPTIDSELLDAWDPCTSITRSMSYQAAGCCETSYVDNGGPFRISWGNDSHHSKEAPHSISDCIRVISGIAQHPSPGVAERVFDGHLMQLLGVATRALVEMEEDGDKLSEKLLDILVDVALNDIDLCQRLFFLLRCFIGVMDGQVSDESAKSLKLLRYAQRRLSGIMFDRSESRDANPHCSKGYPMSRETSSTSSLDRKVTQLDIALSESSLETNKVITPDAPANRHTTFPSQEANNGTAPSLRLDNSDSGDGLSSDNLSCQTPASTITVNSNDTKKKNKVKSSSKIRQLLKGGKSRSSVKKSSDSSQLPPTTRTLKHGSTFSFTNVFHKQSSSLHTIGDNASPSSSPQAPTSMTMSQKFENLIWILRRIDTTCSEIEKKLVKSFPQKMADLALRPWTASKESALASITQNFQAELRRMNSESDSHFPILNPVHSSEQLTSVDPDECYILPSAHFPMLLCFNTCTTPASPRSSRLTSSVKGRFNTLYRTKVELLGLRSTVHQLSGSGEAYIVHGAVGGVVQESGAR
jgi:hypothetical protein